jgi:hypothetical protein
MLYMIRAHRKNDSVKITSMHRFFVPKFWIGLELLRLMPWIGLGMLGIKGEG